MNNKHIIFLTMLNFSNMTIGMDITKYSHPNDPTNLISLSREQLLPKDIKKKISIQVLNEKEWWYLDKSVLSDDTNINLVCFNLATTHLATTSDDIIRIFDITTQKKIVSLYQYSRVNSLCFNPTGTHLATTSYDDMFPLSDDRTVHIYNMATQKKIISFPRDGGVTSIRFNPIGAEIARGTFWDKAHPDKTHSLVLATQTKIISFPHDGSTLSISHLATGISWDKTHPDKAYRLPIAKQKKVSPSHMTTDLI